jgi:3-hydroxybutyryl-CoA dehydrogenase
MKIAVLADENAKIELLSGYTGEQAAIVSVNNIEELLQHSDADAFFDLQFEKNDTRITLLKKLSAKPVFINSVIHTLNETGSSFIRLNGWPTFLKRNLLEAGCESEALKKAAGKIISALNKKIAWVPDIAGFVSARVVSMIVNEAYFALEENISTKNEIDIAMKLGTNYPYGPFEWSEKTGLKNIYGLLTALSKTNARYKPALLLEKEAE